jgi:cob(I)alamin adenosyltransferase
VTFDTLGQGFVGIMGDKKPRETHLHAAGEAYDKVHAVLVAGQHRLVVLDEILSALDEELLTEDQILALMRDRPEDVTLVMTGHKAYDRILDSADLVTEMKKIKHPFDGGYIAMKGIDY